LIAAGGVSLAAVAAGAILVGKPLSYGDAEDAGIVALGERTYSTHCASCHGAKLEGQPNWQERKPDGKLPAPPHDATGHTWHHPDRQLFEITKRGVSGIVPGYQSDMPAYAEILSEREIWAVLGYIKSKWPAPVRARQPQ
jgi:mono/diheme cytochrome c family protein